MQVKDLMTTIPFQLQPTDTIRTTMSRMLESKLTTLPVTDDNRKLLGVITRSILYRLILQDISLDTPIGPYIKQDATCLSSDTPYEDVVEIVHQSDVGTGIVIDHEQRVEGLFTKTDMIFYLLKSSSVLREQLETLLCSIQFGTVMINQEGQVTFANAFFYRLSGMIENQVLQQREYYRVGGTELIQNALARAGGNRSRAAQLLEMSRSTFYEKLKKYKLSGS